MQVRIETLKLLTLSVSLGLVLALGPVPAARAQSDDVILDGRIITGVSRSAAANGGSSGFAYDSTFRGGVSVDAAGPLDGHNTGALRNVGGNASSAGAQHPGGVNVVMGDGSVRPVRSSDGKAEIVTGAGGAPKPGALGSLKNLGSIDRILLPQAAGQGAGGADNARGSGPAFRHHAANAGQGGAGGDGRADLVAGTGGSNGHVKVFDGRALGPGSGPQPNLAGVSGAGAGGSPQVKVIDGTRLAAPGPGGSTMTKGIDAAGTTANPALKGPALVRK